jgi:hypothetical protein
LGKDASRTNQKYEYYREYDFYHFCFSLLPQQLSSARVKGPVSPLNHHSATDDFPRLYFRA